MPDSTNAKTSVAQSSLRGKMLIGQSRFEQTRGSSVALRYFTFLVTICTRKFGAYLLLDSKTRPKITYTQTTSLESESGEAT